MEQTILLAEDEKTILNILKNYFETEGFLVFTAQNGQDAIDIFKDEKIDLVILDVMMPKLSGFEVAKMIRASSNVPIIIMTALNDEDNILKGYSLLIDDYVTKPFNPKVLVANANNLLLRTNNELVVDYKIGDLKFDFINNFAYLTDRKLNLSKTEFNILSFLVKNSDKVCSRQMLLDEIWGMDSFVDLRVVDTNVKKIRKELGNKNYIKTIFGRGYKFEL